MNEATIFTKAVALGTSSERANYLEQVCESETARRRIERLIRLHERSDLIVDQPAVQLSDGDDGFLRPLAQVGETIGPYRLLEEIGEGGMGVVYMAEQKKPVRRRIALKIIKPGMDTKQVIARFESERQALSLMEHENIARVLDAGETDSRRPYFVMELVRGLPITKYCQGERLGTKARLQLFIATCRAVQHAHLKGIIHRDIKPSNVMVALLDGEPVVKMIDFGVAKATNQSLTERTLFTNFSQLVGTPLYMSPEQAEMSGLDVDTRSDIYSLGVLLFELLTDTTPFDAERLRSVPYDEMRRIIREEEPPKPSTRVGTMCAALDTTFHGSHEADARRMRKALRGELDWIVLKALDKNRARRYQTAQDFADDVRRYLEGEPVVACPPSTVYKLRKRFTKHRGLVATASFVTLLLLVTTGVSMWFAIQAGIAEDRAEEARRAAETKEAIATGVSEFLRDDLLGQASPYQDPNRDLSLREVLDRASERIATRFATQPSVEAGIRTTLGTTYVHLAEFEPATRHLTRARDLQRRHLGETAAETLKTDFYLAHLLLSKEVTDEAAVALEQVLAKQREHLDPNDPDKFITMNWLGWCYTLQHRYDRAAPLLREASEGLARVLGPDDPETLECLDAQTRLLWRQGKNKEAATLATRILDTLQGTVGVNHPQYLNMLSAVADAKLRNGESEEALAQFRKLAETRRRIQGEYHLETLHDEGCVARTLTSIEQFDEAEQIFLDVIARLRERYGDEHHRTQTTMQSLALMYQKSGDGENAIRILRQLHVILSETYGESQEAAVEALSRLAHAHADLGEWLPAWEARNRELSLRREAKWQVTPPVHCIHFTAAALNHLERFEEAEALINEGLEQWELSQPHNARKYLSYAALGEALIGQQKYTEAETTLQNSFNAASKHASTRPYILRAMLVQLVRLYEATSDADRAAEARERWMELQVAP